MIKKPETHSPHSINPPAPKSENVSIHLPKFMDALSPTSIMRIEKSMSAVVHFFNLLIAAQATISNEQEVMQAESWCMSLGIPYFRFSPHLEDAVDITESRKAVLTNMMLEGQKYLMRNTDKVDAVVWPIAQQET